MPKLRFSIVISTYNRVNLVERAIRSILEQAQPDIEIIVVDDASKDATSELIPTRYPKVRYLRQERNQGPGAARNRGIKEAVNPWVIILDDDDMLLPSSLAKLEHYIKKFDEASNYPVLQFATSNGYIPKPFMKVQLRDYLQGVIRGDFVPVIQKQLFLKEGFAYPSVRIGGEHLLWWEIAERYGIPTWREEVVQLYHDAPTRLTTLESQIRNAREHAELQELTLIKFNELMKRYSPSMAALKCLGAATYWLLADERYNSRKHLKNLLKSRFFPYALILWLLTWLPLKTVHRMFLIYRKKSLRKS